MKVLIVYANSYRMLAPLPLGASLVADRLRQDGHEVRLLDLLFARSLPKALARSLKGFAPDLIGISLRNVDTQSRSEFVDFLPGYQNTVKALRAALPGATLLLGGSAFTTFPERYLGELGADYGLAGDDLAPISRFVAALAAGSPDLATPGLVYREGGEVRANPYQIAGYADIAFRGWDLIDLRPYRRHWMGMWDASVVVRTGCPFHCIYCDTFRTFGNRWRPRDPRQVAEEMVTLRRRHGARSLFCADAGFNRPLDHAKAVLEEIIRARPGLDICSIFEPGEVDEEFVRLYRRAGGSSMMVFCNSLSERVLAAQTKPFQVGDVLEGVRLLRQGGVILSLALNLGGPGETPETIEETLGRAARIPTMYTWLDRGYRVMPETELHALALREGVVKPEDDCFRATFYFSPATPEPLVVARIKEYNRRHPSGRGWDTLVWSLNYSRQKLAAWLGLP